MPETRTESSKLRGFRRGTSVRVAAGENRQAKSRSDWIREIGEANPELTEEQVKRMAATIMKRRKRGHGRVPSAGTRFRKVAKIRVTTSGDIGPVLFPTELVRQFIDQGGKVDADRVAKAFRMSKGQLAETTGLPAATLSKSERSTGPKAQGRMTEMLEIISRIREWAGGEAQAMAWYRSQPIPALDGRTPEALVKAGRAGAVRDYLDHLALGGFA